jgi:hypothetical protein
MKKILYIFCALFFVSISYARWGSAPFGGRSYSKLGWGTGLFSGNHAQQNDGSFDLSTKEAYPILSVTAVDPPVVTFAGVSETVINGDMEVSPVDDDWSDPDATVTDEAVHRLYKLCELY